MLGEHVQELHASAGAMLVGKGHGGGRVTPAERLTEHALLTWRAELSDLEWLQAHTTGTRQVAGIAAAHTRTLRGTGPEHRLNERAERIDAMRAG